MRGVMKAWSAPLRTTDSKELNELAELLWAGSTYEEKSFAISLLNRFPRLLNGETWKIASRWVERAVGWALCDSLGSGPISAMLYREPSRFGEVLNWAQSSNQWRRRVAAYSMRSFVSAGELDKPFTLLARLIHDEEFWVQRAVGTWFRECWKKDRRRTESFLLRHVKGMPRVVITVATERASRSFRESLRHRRI
jgi:3-methyladenine DNA glycosylase AlkD